MTEYFIQKLMISKKIMDKHNEIPRNPAGSDMSMVSSLNESPSLYHADPIPATYNIPSEYTESRVVSTKPPVVTEDKIKNSKLPDAIKELMLKHPIKQPDQYSPSLSNDVIEKAARLMSENKTITQSANKQTSKEQGNLNGDIRKIIREELENILTENGLIFESESKSNEIFQFRVGKHLFEGKITKIKKVS